MSLSEMPRTAPDRPQTRLTLSNLPPRDTKRWVASRKATVVAAVAQRLITEAEACARYGLTAEELASWRSALKDHGIGALRATRLQLYRSNLDG